MTPIRLQRLEGAIILIASLRLYLLSHGNWWLFALLLFTIDIFMIGYLRGPKIGAWVYNTGHSLFLPGAIALFYLATTGHVPALLFIWFAHIGIDRMLGYGLKEVTGFTHTHLGSIGKSKS
jgi:hypothetical protein